MTCSEHNFHFDALTIRWKKKKIIGRQKLSLTFRLVLCETTLEICQSPQNKYRLAQINTARKAIVVESCHEALYNSIDCVAGKAFRCTG